MKKLAIAVVVVFGLSLLAGCGLLKQKAAGYYLTKARALVQKQAPSQAEIEEAFRLAEKAYSYAKTSSEVVAELRELAEAAAKSGCAKGQELEFTTLTRILEHNSGDWAARHAVIDLLASRGDLSGLADQVIALDKMTFAHDEKGKYCCKLAQLEATAAAIPWIESEAYININRSHELFFEKTYIYSAASEKAADLKTELDKLAKEKPELKNAAPAELAAAAETACAEALRNKETIERANAFNNLSNSDAAFKKAMRMTVQGNEALAAKSYAKARAYYQGAIQLYPGSVYARRAMAEADFQEGAALAAVGESRKEAEQLLAGSYSSLSEVLRKVPSYGCEFPFIKREKFVGETYALKAGAISALRALDPKKGRRTAKLEPEFKASLEEALKLNPEGRMARELFDRYAKEKF